jgi:hypothetical protein
MVRDVFCLTRALQPAYSPVAPFENRAPSSPGFQSAPNNLTQYFAQFGGTNAAPAAGSDTRSPTRLRFCAIDISYSWPTFAGGVRAESRCCSFGESKRFWSAPAVAQTGYILSCGKHGGSDAGIRCKKSCAICRLSAQINDEKMSQARTFAA